MKALKIYETQEFQQGGDPYRTLKIGAPQRIAQIFEGLEDISYVLDDNLNLIIDGDINTILYLMVLIESAKYANNVTVDGEIDLRHAGLSKPIIFPDNLIKITGQVRMFAIKQDIVLPENLYIGGGRADFSYSGIKKLPKGLNVNWDLNIQGTEIDALPDNLHVGMYLLWDETPLAEKYPGRTRYMINKYKEAFRKNQGITILGHIKVT